MGLLKERSQFSESEQAFTSERVRSANLDHFLHEVCENFRQLLPREVRGLRRTDVVNAAILKVLEDDSGRKLAKIYSLNDPLEGFRYLVNDLAIALLRTWEARHQRTNQEWEAEELEGSISSIEFETIFKDAYERAMDSLPEDEQRLMELLLEESQHGNSTRISKKVIETRLGINEYQRRQLELRLQRSLRRLGFDPNDLGTTNAKPR